MKVFSQEVAVLAPFDLWIFLRGIPFFLKGERKNGLFLVGREKCVDTFGLFLLGSKSQPTLSMGGVAIKFGVSSNSLKIKIINISLDLSLFYT